MIIIQPRCQINIILRQGRSKQPVLGTLGYGQQQNALFEDDPGDHHDDDALGNGQHNDDD